MEDEHTGGQQANSLLLLQKEGKMKAKQALTSTEPTVKKDGKDASATAAHDDQVCLIWHLIDNTGGACVVGY